MIGLAVAGPSVRPLLGSGSAGRGLVLVLGLGLVPMVGLVGALAGSPLVAVAGPLLVVLGWVEWRRRRRLRLASTRADVLPVAVDRLLQQLRSGASLSQACRLSAVGPPVTGPGLAGGDPLGSMGRALQEGTTMAEAAQRLRGDVDPSVRLVGLTILVLSANGGPAVPALQRLRHTLVGRAHRRHRADANAAGALASAGLLVLAPGGFALVLAGIEPALARFYLIEPLGAGCVVAAIMLSAAGWWWMQRAVARCGLEGA